MSDTEINNKEEELKQLIETDFFHLYFNISRTSDFSLHFNNLYSFLLTLYNYKTKYKDTVFYYVNLYIRLLIFIRDPYYGLGEKTYSYNMIIALDHFFPQFTFKIIDCFLLLHSKFCYDKNLLPYGCWSDIKYLSIFINSSPNINNNRKNQIINYIVKLTNQQICYDLSNSFLYDPSLTIYTNSNAAKWIPREKNKNLKWLFYKFAHNWNTQFSQKNKLFIKNYRTIISQLTTRFYNNYDTNIKIDRISNNIFFDNSKVKFSSNHTIKYPYDFVNKMIRAINNNDNLSIIDIDFQWNNFIQTYKFNISAIPIIDLSYSPSFCHSSIALACFISHFNSFGKIIYIASDNPTLIDLNDCSSLSSMINSILPYINSINHYKYNIHKTLSIINDSLLISKPTSDVNIIIFIRNKKNMFYNVPFDMTNPPNIILWNMSGDIIDNIDDILYDFKFINSNNINPSFFNHINSLFNNSSLDKYFSFLFSNRYNYLSHFDTSL